MGSRLTSPNNQLVPRKGLDNEFLAKLSSQLAKQFWILDPWYTLGYAGIFFWYRSTSKRFHQNFRITGHGINFLVIRFSNHNYKLVLVRQSICKIFPQDTSNWIVSSVVPGGGVKI